jgi:hypothetical protein
MSGFDVRFRCPKPSAENGGRPEVAKSEAPTTHGWYLDPKDPLELRFWTGAAWSSLTKFPTADELAAARLAGDPSSGAPLPSPRPRPAPEAANSQTGSPRSWAAGGDRVSDHEPGFTLSLLEGNAFTAATIAVSAVYLAVAISIGYVFLALVPPALSVCAFRNREKAAFLSALAAVMAVVIGIGVHR